MVGGPTVKAILGNAIGPSFADHYLARNGFDAQQTDEPANPGRPTISSLPSRDAGGARPVRRAVEVANWQLLLRTHPIVASAVVATALTLVRRRS